MDGDIIFVNIEIKFAFLDRLKILFGRNAIVEIETETENKPGKCESKSKFKLLKNKRNRNKLYLKSR